MARIYDGDTLDVVTAPGTVRVRLFGIDAPEHDQRHGNLARDGLRSLLRNSQVTMQLLNTDRYQRQVAIVTGAPGNINEAMLERGLAWAYRYYLPEHPDAARYCELENRARTARRGLWRDRKATAPWLHRNRGEPALGDTPSLQECLAAVRRVAQSANTSPPSKTCTIKGNINRAGEKIFHLPGSTAYARTRINTAAGERWFCSEKEAAAAGWRAARDR
ncbi:MAG: thermonuclease family protein [Gammaproteobacteria bacterium]|nr:thermonuclease family protein [Gammaproteobacteria bacterium]